MKHTLNISNKQYIDNVGIGQLVTLFKLLVDAFPEDLILIHFYHHELDAHVIKSDYQETPYAKN